MIRVVIPGILADKDWIFASQQVRSEPDPILGGQITTRVFMNKVTKELALHISDSVQGPETCLILEDPFNLGLHLLNLYKALETKPLVV